jgi:8-oxo-dGTP pyrophosphatase MutT (NUDIX family)
MRRVSVRGIALLEGSLLCVKLKPYNEMAASGGDWRCLPGGTVDEGEALEESLMREMQEETGVTPQIGRLLYVHQFLFKENDQLEFFFHITNPTDYLEIDLENTSHGAEEIESIDFVDPKTTVILPKFLSQEALENHIKEGASVKIFSFVK